MNCISTWIVAAFAMLGASAGAHATDIDDLEENFPTEIEDTIPNKPGELEVQVFARFDREPHARNQLQLAPLFQIGLGEGWQAKFSIPTFLASEADDRRRSGDLRAELFREISKESMSLPAFAASLRVDAPSGRDSRGVDTTAKLIATRTLAAEHGRPQVHANLIFQHNAAPLPEERSHRTQFIIGYSMTLADRLGLVADIVREQLRDQGRNATILEAGLRRKLSPLATFSFGAGFGIGPDSPRLRLVLGVQHGF